MEKIHPTSRPTEKQLLSSIRRSLVICDPHAAIHSKSAFNMEKYRLTIISKKQAA